MVKLKDRRRDEYGNLYFLMKINSQTLEIPAEIYELANKNGLSTDDLRHRIRQNGFKVTMHVARAIPDKDVKKLIVEEKAREERLLTREEQKLKVKKPHLFNVPQNHDFGKYAQSLKDNNTFVKIKTDCYGRTQRG